MRYKSAEPGAGKVIYPCDVWSVLCEDYEAIALLMVKDLSLRAVVQQEAREWRWNRCRSDDEHGRHAEKENYINSCSRIFNAARLGCDPKQSGTIL